MVWRGSFSVFHLTAWTSLEQPRCFARLKIMSFICQVKSRTGGTRIPKKATRLGLSAWLTSTVATTLPRYFIWTDSWKFQHDMIIGISARNFLLFYKQGWTLSGTKIPKQEKCKKVNSILGPKMFYLGTYWALWHKIFHQKSGKMLPKKFGSKLGHLSNVMKCFYSIKMQQICFFPW